MTMNLRNGNTFIQNEGWYAAASRYQTFVPCQRQAHILLLELSVSANTPVIIKYPFWKMAAENLKATYACINYGEAFCPDYFHQSICIDRDIRTVLRGFMRQSPR